MYHLLSKPLTYVVLMFTVSLGLLGILLGVLYTPTNIPNLDDILYNEQLDNTLNNTIVKLTNFSPARISIVRYQLTNHTNVITKSIAVQLVSTGSSTSRLIQNRVISGNGDDEMLSSYITNNCTYILLPNIASTAKILKNRGISLVGCPIFVRDTFIGSLAPVFNKELSPEEILEIERILRATIASFTHHEITTQ